MKTNFRKTIVLFLAAVISLTCLTAVVYANDMTIEIPTRKNTAPVAENLQLTTYRGIAITSGFKATDPDGDAMTFEITSAPKKGEVKATGSCEFVYTPGEKSKGKDTFTYVAVDANGGVSATATVTINIKKQSSKTTYADMDGNPAHYASLVLSEENIFDGEKLGGESFFKPDATVTRGEFLAMCLAMTGTETLDGITKTGFSDDSDIPLWVKPYVSAALLNGVIGGYRDETGSLVFSSNAPITYTEAVVMIDRTLGLTDVVSVSSFDSDAVPAWAQASVVNAMACGIVSGGVSEISSQCLTRAEAAMLLLRSIEVMNSRPSNSGGLLSWAK